MSSGSAATTRSAGRWRPIVAAAAAAIVVGSLGALSTDIGPWYRSLKEPWWKPPDILFGPAWTAIYACAASAGVIAWRRAVTRAQRGWILGLFALNAFANVLWSVLFFRMQRPDWALAEVALLWLTIAALMFHLGRLARAGAWLLLPYILWVSFAALLNDAVVRLNGPFG